MTDAPKIDTQAPERIKTILRNNLSGPTFFDAQVKAAHEDDLNRVSHLLASLSAAREAAAAQAMRERLASVEDMAAKYGYDEIADAVKAAADELPTDPAAALDRLIAERVREAVEAEREACAKIADEHVARYQALLDKAKHSEYMTYYGRMVDAVEGVADDIRAARGSKEGRDG